jgi:tetratricopeptide (TPR) repeat protein
MDNYYMRIVYSLVLATFLMVSESGCASSVTGWIVQTRNHQGDVALQHFNYADASVAYQLALKVEPKNEHARAGLVSVQIQLAQTAFAASHFDDAIHALAIAYKYSPEDERIAGLHGEIEQAEIKRDIVVSNYPAYRETGTTLLRAYTLLKANSDAVGKSIKKFSYTYDTNALSKAIRDSYELSEELTRDTNRLVLFRQLVESGVPESTKAAESLAPPASLLPLP